MYERWLKTIGNYDIFIALEKRCKPLGKKVIELPT